MITMKFLDKGGFFSDPQKILHFGNSGTGVRLMAGLLSTSEINATLTGDKSLSSRPMKRIIDPLQEMNVSITHNNGLLPIKVFNHNNQYIPINHTLNVGSAQVKSCILLAALNTKGTTKIVEKIPSRDHTEIMLKFLGANLIKEKNVIKLTSPNFLKPKELKIPGDFSSAAFVIIAVLLSKKQSNIKRCGSKLLQDWSFRRFKKMNANITVKNKRKFNGEIVGDIEVESSNLVAQL
ncbi:MAG: hypothetical protein CM15mP40_01690 [Alphaproteobacteria bacterium]|nr:MAG: hypothetical protein CM15mP40_01690 [Alphaproteobacteria bacterium]